MAKPMLVTLPFVLLLIDVWPLGRARPDGGTTWRGLVFEKVPLVGLAIAASITTVLLQRQAGAMGDGASDAFPIGLRIGNAIVSYAAYLGQTVWPAGLAPFYPYPRSIPTVSVVVSLLVLIGLSFAAVRAARQRPYVLVGWLWYVGMLVPVIGLIQVGQQSRADRYTYLPLVGIFFTVAWGVPELVARSRQPRSLIQAAAGLVVLAFAVTAWFQVETWRNSFSLWTHALEVTTDNDRAYNGLGAELGNRGKIDEAIGKFQEAIRINPSFADAHVNLAVALSLQGKVAEAIPHYAEALRLQPGHREARNHYAEALERVGRLDEAAQQYRLSLQMDPSQPEALAGLGLVLAQQGQLAEALETERAAVRVAPNSVKALYGLGAVLAVSHQVDEAIRVFNEVLRLDPGNQAARQALAQIRK
jgi:tetratricopeptide (TPR) repeat protein